MCVYVRLETVLELQPISEFTLCYFNIIKENFKPYNMLLPFSNAFWKSFLDISNTSQVDNSQSVVYLIGPKMAKL